jgi:hypothetical protein
MKLAGMLWTFFGMMLALFAYIFGLAIIRAVTFLILWGWFIVPLGLPGLNVWWALGLMTTIGLFFYQKNDPDSVELKKADGAAEVAGVLLGVLGHMLLFCLLAISFGAIYHGLM